jgi:hypothetical protein
MIRKENNLDRLGWIIQIHVSVRVGVLVGCDGTGKKFHAADWQTIAEGKAKDKTERLCR